MQCPPPIGRDDATARKSTMMHASALAVGWRSALRALADSHRTYPRLAHDARDGELRTDTAEQPDDEREPFHLDDEELASRLVRDCGPVRHSTPPHTHRRFLD